MSEKLTPSTWQTLALQRFGPEDRQRIDRALDAAYERGFKPNEIKPFFRIADIRAARDLLRLRQQATERVAEFTHSYSAALDDACALLLTLGHRNIARVLTPGGVDELWVDAPADRTRVSEVMPGRCVYRQWTRFADGVVSIEREWLDPEIAKAVRP